MTSLFDLEQQNPRSNDRRKAAALTRERYELPRPAFAHQSEGITK